MDYEERQALRNRRVNITTYLPMTLIEVIDRIAESEGKLSTNAVLERLIRTGLQVERDRRASATA